MVDLLPGIFCKHMLSRAWAYKYDNRINSGINIHGDTAAINVNFWLTEDEANIGGSEDEPGGLIVFHKTSATGLEFDQYNVGDRDAQQAILEGSNFERTTVPYKENRVVIFRSEMFHTSDRYTLQYTIIHYYTLSYTIIHNYTTLSYTIIHYYTLLYTIIHYYTLLYTIIHYTLL